MKKIAIIGSSDLALQLTRFAEVDCGYNVVGYFDDFHDKGTYISGKPILGNIDSINKNYENRVFDTLVIGVGYKEQKFRATVFSKFKGKIPFENLIHDSCIIDKSVILGEGVVLFAGTLLDMNVEINDNVLVNVGCVIAHDTSIGEHTFISPGVKVAGFVEIGKSCNIGINTTIIDNIKVVNSVKTGGGTVVVRNIEKPGLYVGNPQRFIR